MNYKTGLRKIHEMNVAGGAGGMFGAGGNQGGNVGNVDSYAPGDARVPKVIGAGGNDPYEYVNKKGKKKKSGKKDKIPVYRRTFSEMLTTEAYDDTEYLLNCVIYSKDINNKKIIQDIMERYGVTHIVDDDCVILEGSDEYIQQALNHVTELISEDEFTNGNIIALIGEMDITSNKLAGGMSEGKTLDDFRKRYTEKGYPEVSDFEKQFNDKIKQGTKVEMEHTTDDKIAREIALDHIWEDFFYYDKLAKMEKK
jgi:hypothetical protein